MRPNVMNLSLWWHRLDVHTAAILAFDSDQRLRLVTLAHHNHHHTYMAGVDLLKEITPFIDDLRNTDWRAIVQVMRGRLADAILNHPVQHSQGALVSEMLPLN